MRRLQSCGGKKKQKKNKIHPPLNVLFLWPQWCGATDPKFIHLFSYCVENRFIRIKFQFNSTSMHICAFKIDEIITCLPDLSHPELPFTLSPLKRTFLCHYMREHCLGCNRSKLLGSIQIVLKRGSNGNFFFFFSAKISKKIPQKHKKEALALHEVWHFCPIPRECGAMLNSTLGLSSYHCHTSRFNS